MSSFNNTIFQDIVYFNALVYFRFQTKGNNSYIKYLRQ